MAHRGTLTAWKDDRGFGFITPADGGKQVFVHIGAFANPSRRPIRNEIVTYRLARDSKGRIRAVNVAFVGERRRVSRWTSNIAVLGFVVLFFASVISLFLAGKLPAIIPGWYLVTGVITFAFYAVDKSAARKGRWRTPETTLHLLGLAGGWPGALIAQGLLRHKSRKTVFQWIFRVTVILNIAALGWLLTPEGTVVLRSTIGTLQ